MATPSEVIVFIQIGGALIRLGKGIYEDIRDAITDTDPDFDINVAFMKAHAAAGRARIAQKLEDL